MKKIFTLLTLCIFAIAAKAQITIYVKCETAPFIWMWGAADGIDYNIGGWPGENQLRDKYTHPDTGEDFWTYTFPEGVYPISFLFNDGAASGTKQTGDVNSVKTDRWFILSWDDGAGNVSFEDVTEDYSDVQIPDAEINSVILVGNHNSWDSSVGEVFTAIEAGKTFQLTINTAEYSIDENLWQFKFRPNAQEWVGYWDVNNHENLPAWIDKTSDGNFLIDLEEGTTEKEFTFTATWGGGKEAGKNWTFTAVAGTDGINTVKAINDNSAAIYNMQGQRVDSNYRGIAIKNGRKVVMK